MTAPRAAEARRRSALAASSEAQGARAAMTVQQALTEAEGTQRVVTKMAQNNLNEVAAIKGYEAQIEMHQRAAREAREKTESALRDIENAAQDAAGEIAQQAKDILKQDAVAAEAKAKQLELKFNPPSAPISVAAAEAAAPYNAAMNRALGMQSLYSAKAQEQSNTAKMMQNQAEQLASDAVAYQDVGDPNAASMFANAKDMIRRAEGLDSEAHSNQKVAEGINQSIPAYQISAAAAAARARILANPAGQPPLPV